MLAVAAALGAAVAALEAKAGKVQVYIMMGQSNMLGEGKIGGPGDKDTNGTLQYAEEHGKYPYLWDASGKNWTVSKTVRNVFTMGSGAANMSKAKLETNDWMTGGTGHGGKIGPELGIGFMLEKHAPTTPVMALKSCIGNRALGWDLLPPGSPSKDWTDPKNSSLVYNYAGYHESPQKCLKSDRGTAACTAIKWYAGCQYDGDIKRANDVLADLPTYYPGATDYEVAGFFWWQGDRDSRDHGHSDHYEGNLVALIKALRAEYKVPNAPFVTASLGQSFLPASACAGVCGGEILQAMLNVANATKYPEFKGNVAAVDSHPLSMGSASGSHYGGDARTYMNIGQAMGEAMVGLLK